LAPAPAVFLFRPVVRVFYAGALMHGGTAHRRVELELVSILRVEHNCDANNGTAPFSRNSWHDGG